jgi:ribosomal protein L11 methyltransferase
MNYYELQITIGSFDEWHDIFVAYLAELDYESFVEETPILKAYIQEAHYNGQKLQALLKELNEKGAPIATFELALLPQQNWNATWEAQFEPVFINDNLRIVAPFHTLAPTDGIEIKILPKMSFGTGHHQTTHLICENMLALELQGKKVLDMGAGTGVRSKSRSGLRRISLKTSRSMAVQTLRRSTAAHLKFQPLVTR